MTRISEIFHELMGFGWCPNTATTRTAPTKIALPPVSINHVRPDGGAGGSGCIDREVNPALASLRILIGNWRLLWFTILTGLGFVFSFITMFALQYLFGSNPFAGFGLATGSLPPVLIALGSPVWVALTFAIQWAAAFGITFSLAGLITCVSLLLSCRTATIREGLSDAMNRLWPVTGWATVFAGTGTVQSIVANLYPGKLFLIFISSTLMISLGFLMIFVVPVLVLGEKGLAGAVADSSVLIRKTWGEILVCFFVYIVLCFIAALVFLIPAVVIGFPSGDAVRICLSLALYLLVLVIITMIYTTADGIFLIGIPTQRLTGWPGIFMESS
jgi:hypothetical protein